MIGCSQHRSKEDPDRFAAPCTHIAVHIRAVLVDGNALGHAPSHHVKRHTSHEFGLCHMWFSPSGRVSAPLPWISTYGSPSTCSLRTGNIQLHMCCTSGNIWGCSNGLDPNHVPAPGRATSSRWSWNQPCKNISSCVIPAADMCSDPPQHSAKLPFFTSPCLAGHTELFTHTFTHSHSQCECVKVCVKSIWRTGSNGE